MPRASAAYPCALRAQSDVGLVLHAQRVWQANMQVCEAKKVWRQLNREGITVVR